MEPGLNYTILGIFILGMLLSPKLFLVLIGYLIYGIIY